MRTINLGQIPTYVIDASVAVKWYLILAGIDMSVRFGCSFYDGLYVALAGTLGVPLIHADVRLARALGSDYPLAIYLPDYRSPPG